MRLGPGLLLGVGWCFGIQAQVAPPCVADSSASASGPALGFLAGLSQTARYPPYLKLVLSFLFISAAVQVPAATWAAQARNSVSVYCRLEFPGAVLGGELQGGQGLGVQGLGVQGLGPRSQHA